MCLSLLLFLFYAVVSTLSSLWWPLPLVCRASTDGLRMGSSRESGDFPFDSAPDARASSAALMTGRLRSLAGLPFLPDESFAASVSFATLMATLDMVGTWQSMLV